MQRDPVVSKASELLRLGLMPSASEIKAGKVRSHVPTSPRSHLTTNVHWRIVLSGLIDDRYPDGRREGEARLIIHWTDVLIRRLYCMLYVLNMRPGF